ncbi:isochorismatase hydrolase [Methylobacterium sp. 4-46]|uniref:cysteine hydrolase family protein n=1 Tax=unclassified Methylobacterium TaxID=2615210 RepID=UPI000152DD00|nr:MULTISPECIES: cysteine hydrolase family protein [Methylobacterium]ACA16329.1 isochorismatase hydrolase [Methylobacterium sp. 4-46]WFT82036.1 cysteine hydrolase family protein [Methylobacterium nodulans]
MPSDSPVLIPIDMQRAFDAPPWPRRWNADLDRNGRQLLAAWRRAGLPIIHVRHDSVEPGSTLRPGLPGHAFRDGFAPLDGEPVVAKSVNSAFIGTDLDLRLRRLGAPPLVVFGIATDMCVSTTVRTGANLGWAITLVADACDCFDLPDTAGGVIRAEQVQAVHRATLAYEFCRVVSTREAVSALTGA